MTQRIFNVLCCYCIFLDFTKAFKTYNDAFALVFFYWRTRNPFESFNILQMLLYWIYCRFTKLLMFHIAIDSILVLCSYNAFREFFIEMTKSWRRCISEWKYFKAILTQTGLTLKQDVIELIVHLSIYRQYTIFCWISFYIIL